MRTVVRALAQVLLVALLLGTSAGHVSLLSRASAQASPAVKARARELYTQGQQLFRQGDFTNAQRSFEDAYRAVPNPVVLLSIAECQVRAEEYGNAVKTLRQYLSEKPGAPDRSQVESQINNLESKPGSVSIESTPPGAVIWVDGENTGYLTPNEISIRAGSHAVSLTASGYESTEKQVDVAIGSRQRLSLTLTPLAQAQAQVAEEDTNTPSETVEEPSETTTGRHATPAMWTAGGIAVGTAIIGTALGVSALKKASDYDKNPERDLQKKGDKLALFADVSFGVAIVAGVTTLVLYLTSSHAEQPSEQAFVIAPELKPNEMGLSGRMRF